MKKKRILGMLLGLVLVSFKYSIMSTPISHMTLQSSVFQDGQAIPEKYTCDGQNISPPLNWSGVPVRTKSFAILCHNFDISSEKPLVHWVIFNIPYQIHYLSKGQPPSGVRVGEYGIKQGKNDFIKSQVGYCGPCSVADTEQRCIFRIFALDRMLNVQPGATDQQVHENMKNHILGTGRLVGTYQKK